MFAAPKGSFGVATSPVVEGNRVIVDVGAPKAGIVAFDAATGSTLWTATGDDARGGLNGSGYRLPRSGLVQCLLSSGVKCGAIFD